VRFSSAPGPDDFTSQGESTHKAFDKKLFSHSSHANVDEFGSPHMKIKNAGGVKTEKDPFAIPDPT
jgi:hypothetical protein